ncbi:hypothetical protein HKCCE3408_14760 [Rhodobacterales bacterium HKCCE3408]|nr:hypothetical protein [Rhodobacterales bacterium HKCCE3408]
MRIGLICSGGGAVIGAAHRLLVQTGHEVNWFMVTDRYCAGEAVANQLAIPQIRIVEQEAERFSEAAADWLFQVNSVDTIVLFFTRLVTRALFERGRCINLHPSLLPAFPGFGALNAAWTSGTRLVGATAHEVDDTIDGGPVLAQVTQPRPGTRAMLDRVSFAQKLHLFLWIALGAPSSPRGRSWCDPLLPDPDVAAALAAFLRAEGIPWPE